MEPKITEVELTNFTFTRENVRIGTSRYGTHGLEYESGAILDRHYYALKIKTNIGISGEYVGRRGDIGNLGQYLIGKNPLKREKHWIDNEDMGMIDIALWDFAGKYYDAPIHELLGSFQTRLPAYASAPAGDEAGGLDSPEAMAKFAEECQRMGYPAFKHHSWLISSNNSSKRQNIQREIKALEKIREQVGPEMDLMLDPSGELPTFSDALKVGRACDSQNYFWYEDPHHLGERSLQSSRKLRQLLKTPMLQTEAVRGVQPKTDFLVNEATDFVRVSHLEVDGGITGAMKIANVAEGFGIDVEYNAPGPGQRHCLAATRNSNYYELGLVHPDWTNIHYPPIYENGYSDELDAIDENGTVPVPNGPGLGVKYNWDYIQKNSENVQNYS